MINYKKIVIFIFLLMFIQSFAAATTYASLKWSKSLTSSVNTIDTAESGDKVFVGLSNGTIVSYDGNGNIIWQLNVNGSITKLITISDGSKVVAMNNKNQTYWIDGSNGYLIKTFMNTSVSSNISDIGISRDGLYFAVAGNSSLSVFNSNGSYYASNNSFPLQCWSKVAFDPFANWMVVTNGINKTFKWNITTYTGWPEMNFYKDTPNQSNIRDNGFPYKYSFTSILMDQGYNSSYNISFIENRTVGANIYPGLFQYNNNFYFNKSICGNLSIRSTETLNNIVSKGNNINPPNIFNVTILEGYRNITIYYGNMSYQNSFPNGSIP